MTIPVPLFAAAYLLGCFAIFPLTCSLLGWTPEKQIDSDGMQAVRVIATIVAALWPVAVPALGAVFLATVAVQRLR